MLLKIEDLFHERHLARVKCAVQASATVAIVIVCTAHAQYSHAHNASLLSRLQPPVLVRTCQEPEAREAAAAKTAARKTTSVLLLRKFNADAERSC